MALSDRKWLKRKQTLWCGIGWSEADPLSRLKGDREKVRIARVLREQTTVSLAWIAARLKMGSWTYVSDLLSQSKRGSSTSRCQS